MDFDSPTHSFINIISYYYVNQDRSVFPLILEISYILWE